MTGIADPDPIEEAASSSARRAWLVFGVATFFAFPHEMPFLPGIVVDLGLLLSWIVPVGLVVAVSGRTPRQAARSAFFASFVTHAAFFYWFLVVTMVYAGMPFVLGILAPLVPALYVGPFTALFAWAWRRFSGSSAVIAAPYWSTPRSIAGPRSPCCSRRRPAGPRKRRRASARRHRKRC